jgi:hypothetical protein
MYNLIVFEKMEEAMSIKRILGGNVVLIGNCLSCYNNKETFDVVLGYCESNKYKISLLEKEIK